MKHLVPFLLLAPLHSIANEPPPLPTENISYELVSGNNPKRLTKDEFESTKEFNLRLKSESVSKPVNAYVKKSLSYNADKEIYSFECFSDYTAVPLKDDTRLISREGINSFGAKWGWSEKVGGNYELRYLCPENHKGIKIPLKQAKLFRSNFIAIFQLEIKPQNWISEKIYETPSFGAIVVDNFYRAHKIAEVIAIHYGLNSDSSIYKSINLKEMELQAKKAAEAKYKNLTGQQKHVASEKQRYTALIKATIERNLIVNDALKGKRCSLNIRLGIGGVVLKVNQLSGDDALCRAVINAVYKPANLPVSRDPAVSAELRDINLTVER
jgi:hypothetical protein